MSSDLLNLNLEFARRMVKVNAVAINPFSSRNGKQKVVGEMVASLSQECFIAFVPQIFRLINMKEDRCREFQDTQTQVDDILGYIPRLKEYKDMLFETVKIERQKHGLKV